MSYVTIVQTQAADEVVLLERLEALRQRGNVSPEALVAEARPEASPIHHLFTWDDGVAAERYRYEQARLYMVRVEYIPAEEREPLLVEMPVVRQRPTRVDARCLSGVDLTMCSIDRCQTEIEDLRKRYCDCPALADVLEQLAIASKAATLAALALDVPPTEAERERLPAWVGR